MGTTPFRRRVLLVGGAASSLALPGLASAQTILPDKALYIVVGFAPGSGADTVARRFATPLERRVGRHVTVANKPGGAGAIPSEVLRRDGGEGTLVGLVPSTTLVSNLTVSAAPHDPGADVTPITLAGTWPIGLAVSPKLGLRTFDDYRKWLKTEGTGVLKLGSTAGDGFNRAFALMLGKVMDVKFAPVTYRGPASLATDLAEGRLPAALTGVVSMAEYHRGGRLRLLMTTGPMRLAAAPDVPTARELGHADLEDLEWFAFFAPAKTPARLIDEWRRHLHAVLSDKGLSTEMTTLGVNLETSTSEEAAARIAGHLKMWKERMQSVGMIATN